MEILVCIKQVPDTAEAKITTDPETGTLNRKDMPSIVNPFDKNAIEEAIQIKERIEGTKVTVLTMGPEQAKTALKECLAMGADQAILLSDKAFAGSDTLATGYALAMAAKKLGNFDLILCGKQAVDGDTAQVGPQIAEQLGIAQLTYVAKLDIDGENVKVQREFDDGYEVIETKLPVLVTVVKSINEPRFPTVRSTMKANRAKIPVMTAEEIGADVTKLGLKGSPTRVRKVFTPPARKAGLMIQKETAEENVSELIAKMHDAKVV